MFLISKNFFFKFKVSYTYFCFIFKFTCGFFLGENSTGGAFQDYLNQKQITLQFSKNFLETLLNYDNLTTRHSPILLIILSQLEQIISNDFCYQINLFAFLSFASITFFKILKLKYIKLPNK